MQTVLPLPLPVQPSLERREIIRDGQSSLSFGPGLYTEGAFSLVLTNGNRSTVFLLEPAEAERVRDSLSQWLGDR